MPQALSAAVRGDEMPCDGKLRTAGCVVDIVNMPQALSAAVRGDEMPCDGKLRTAAREREMLPCDRSAVAMRRCGESWAHSYGRRQDSWGFLKASKEEKQRSKVALPKLDGKGAAGPDLDDKKNHAADIPQITPRLFLATTQQSYKARAPIEKLAMKRWAVRHDPELWPTICPQ
eukprot:s329_g25.t1